MNKFSFSLYTVVLIYCTCTTVLVNGRKSDDLLREDLAEYGGAELKDGDFEIVQFWHRDIKCANENKKELRFRRSGNNIIWTMKETSVIREETPVWVVYINSTIHKADDNIISEALKFYENPTLFLTVATSVNPASDSTDFVGFIGGARVAPLSKRTIRSLLKEKPHLFEERKSTHDSEKFTLSDYHVIYIPKTRENGTIVLPPMGSLELLKKSESKINGPSHNRLKRSTAKTVYPEVLAVLDYDEEYPSIHGSGFLNLIIYTINFWNSVNLRFSTLYDPKIKLRLTGIVVNMKRRALPFISHSIRSDMLNTDVRQLSSRWVDSSIPAATYDIIVIQTNMELCLQDKAGHCENDGILGAADIGPECHGDQYVMSGVIHDDMKYAGVHTAAHEIGHMLGAKHDRPNSPNDCSGKKGYILSYNADYIDHPFEWSRCSRNSFSERLRFGVDKCLDNDTPFRVQGDLVNQMLLPGQRISKDVQCQDRGYSGACESSDICQKLSCSGWLWCSETAPPYDGTPCPIGECRNGRCVLTDQKQ